MRLQGHCETEFNRIRATAFPKAYSEKDKDALSGSKGDYIFRDSDDAGTEIVIMVEMKNENDGTVRREPVGSVELGQRELDRERHDSLCDC